MYGVGKDASGNKRGASPSSQAWLHRACAMRTTLPTQSSAGTLLIFIQAPFCLPPIFFSPLLIPSPSVPCQTQAACLLHGMRWEKGQNTEAACRQGLCHSGWEEIRHPKESEKLQSDWQLGRGQFGLANFRFSQT